MTEFGVEEVDRFHAALHTHDLHVLAHPERLGKNNRQSGDHVAQHALHGQGHAGARHAQPGDERQQFYPKVL